jgi:hypothetical protein
MSRTIALLLLCAAACSRGLSSPEGDAGGADLIVVAPDDLGPAQDAAAPADMPPAPACGETDTAAPPPASARCCATGQPCSSAKATCVPSSDGHSYCLTCGGPYEYCCDGAQPCGDPALTCTTQAGGLKVCRPCGHIGQGCCPAVYSSDAGVSTGPPTDCSGSLACSGARTCCGGDGQIGVCCAPGGVC